MSIETIIPRTDKDRAGASPEIPTLQSTLVEVSDWAAANSRDVRAVLGEIFDGTFDADR